MEIAPAVVSEALKAGRAERLSGEIEYIRFTEQHRGIGHGTVVAAGGKAIRTYPHIKRIFTLENGLKRNMADEWLHAEEKIDGFNVRIASVGGRIFAFSRGGFLDAFVTEKAREAPGVASFLRRSPECVLCCEMVGNTPYTAPERKFDVRIYVFDIDRGDGTHMTCEERYAAVKAHGLLSVPVLGKFRSTDYAGLRKTALALNRWKREGMVLKGGGGRNVLKYVTPWSDIEDISKASGMLFDMPLGFFHQRVLRSAMFIRDFGLDKDEYAKKLGRALHGGLEEALGRAGAGGDVGEEFEISVRDTKIWDDLHRHMSRGVKLEELWRKSEGERTRIRFRKIYKKTTKLLSSYCRGKGVAD